MSSRAAAKMVKQNIIPLQVAPAFVSACFVGKIDANTERQIALPDQGPRQQCSQGAVFSLLELTRRVGRGRKPNKATSLQQRTLLINGG